VNASSGLSRTISAHRFRLRPRRSRTKFHPDVHRRIHLRTIDKFDIYIYIYIYIYMHTSVRLCVCACNNFLLGASVRCEAIAPRCFISSARNPRIVTPREEQTRLFALIHSRINYRDVPRSRQSTGPIDKSGTLSARPSSRVTGK